MVTKRRGRSQDPLALAKDIIAFENNEPASPRKDCRECLGKGVYGGHWRLKTEAETWGSESYKQEHIKKMYGRPCHCTYRGGNNRRHGPALVAMAKFYVENHK